MLRCAALLVFVVSAGFATGSDYSLPDRIEVLPVAFVPLGEQSPTADEQKLFMKHLQLAQDRFRVMLDGDSFDLAESKVQIIKGQKPLDFYRRPPERGAPDIVSELLTHLRLTRFNCPYVFCILLMNSKDNFPEGGGRSINGGINTGGGMMYIASWELTHNTHFQTTLQHELGHAFGLAHVDVYGYDMKTNASIMSYNPAHHCQGLKPSSTPGALIPEDRRGLALNDRVFANTTFNQIRDVPFGYALSKRIVPLGPMTLPGQPDFYPQITTTGGEDVFSKVINIVRAEIKPSAGPGITYDPGTMWHSKPLPDGKATLEITFPFPVTLTAIAIHSQHSGIHHETTAMRLETNDQTRTLVVEKPVKSIDETVTFAPTEATKWSLTLTAGASRILVMRGLQFFNGEEEICPHMVPYQAIAKSPAEEIQRVQKVADETAASTGKKPVPDAMTQEKARKAVKEKFKAEIAKAKKPEAKAGLARTLMERADAQTDDDMQFAYFAEAIFFAGQAGDLDLALQAVTGLSEKFEVDSIDWKQRAATAVGSAGLTLDPAQVEALIAKFSELANEAAAADEYVAAVNILKAAADLVKKAIYKPLKDDATFLIKQMTGHKEAFDAVKNAREKLRTNPDDATANLAWGRFVCFYKHDWEHGLPLLVKADDKVWAPLAQREINAPQTAPDWLQLGDDWQQAGIREKDVVKFATLERADHAWQQALATATQLQKKEMESKVDQRLVKLFGSSYAVTKGDAAGVAIPGSDRLSPTDNFTIEFWVATTSPKGTLLSKKHTGEESSFIVHLDNTEPNLSIAVGGGEGGGGGGGSINDGKWHHLAVVKQMDELTLYVDGGKATGSRLKAPLQSRSPWKFGTSQGRIACEARFGGIRISKSARYLDAFTPERV
ncbi:MAG TPA: LamG-like jellyroll fold domain-containing protein, partial [Schlesneria sp.]